MRCLPFRVICLVGMNDQAFPRRDQPAEFDYMAGDWKPGDPRKGDEDRYLLLETLLCTRQILYISYVGRDMKDNSARQPSVLVRELLDFVDRQYTGTESDHGTLSQQLTHHHPMQAFSPRNYLGAVKSYDRYWCALAQAVSLPPRKPGTDNWPSLCLETAAEESQDIDLARLLRFVRHPVKFFVNTGLKIYLTEQTIDEDEENFVVEGLLRWELTSRLIKHFLDGEPVKRQQLQAQGLLPHGALAITSFAEAENDASPLLDQLVDYAGRRPQPLLIDLAAGNGYRVSGQIHGYYPGKGLLRYHVAAKLKGKHLLAAWLEHLILCACGQLPEHQSSTLICKQESRRFGFIPQSDATQMLQTYLDAYREGLRRPLPVLPEASLAWALETDAEKARANALKKWQSDDYQRKPADSDDPYIQLVLRGLDANPIDHPEFASLAGALYGQVLQHGANL
jgi:exodeoxyribonuclease V gamma subunit